MDRRDFLKTTGGAAAAVATSAGATMAAAGTDAKSSVAAAPAVHSATKELRVAFNWPDNGRGFADSARRLARRIELATGQRYRFKFIATGKTGIEAVRSGEADAYHASEHDNLDLHRGFAYFAGLPGFNGLRASALDAWMLAGGGQTLWDELAAEHGVKALLAGHTGRSTGLWGARPMTSLADFTGAKVWAMGLARDVVRGIGADASTHAAPDLSRALGANEVAAAEAGGAVASYGLGILERAPHALGASINRNGTALSLGFARPVWDAMSAGDQAIITAVAASELHTAIAEEKAHRQLLLAHFQQTKTEPPASSELANAIARVADGVVAHLAALDTRTQRINASYVAFRRAIGIKPISMST